MLIQRIISALILAPIVICLIIYSSLDIFFLFAGLIACLAIYEWAKLFNNSNGPICLVTAIMILLAVYFYSNLDIYINLILLFNLLVWIILFILMLYYGMSNNGDSFINKVYKTDSLQVNKLLLFLGLQMFLSFWLGLVYLKYINYKFIIFVFIAVWSFDTGSYFLGKFYGNKKLLPKVSPGKTIAGVIGGIVSIVIISMICYLFSSDVHSLFNSKYTLFYNMIILTVISIFALFGDLTESMFKRIANKKDSSNIIPGHGGILDRIDSLLPVVTLFVIFYLF